MLLGAVVLPLGGCDLGTKSCTLEARISMLLEVVDAETGAPVEATVTYLIDGEEPSSPPEENGPGRYDLGLEDEGTFEVTVSADGYGSVTREFEVESDECHVKTVEATIELQPAS